MEDINCRIKFMVLRLLVVIRLKNTLWRKCYTDHFVSSEGLLRLISVKLFIQMVFSEVIH